MKQLSILAKKLLRDLLITGGCDKGTGAANPGGRVRESIEVDG
jgi:hypothetical protein